MSVLDFGSAAVRLLAEHVGREKSIRTVYYALLLLTGRMKDRKLAAKLMNLAKQLSTTRLVLRRLDDLPMLYSCAAHFAGSPKLVADRMFHALNGLVTLLYTVHGPVEHVGWLCELKILNGDSSRWYRYSVVIWVVGLTLSLFSAVRNLARISRDIRRFDSSKTYVYVATGVRQRLLSEQSGQTLLLISLLADLMNAVNFLPKGFLWSQSFPQWKVGLWGFIASLAGWIRLFSDAYNKLKVANR